MQKVHSGRLNYRGARPLDRKAKLDLKRLAAAFRASAAAVETVLLEKLTSGARISFFRVVGWMC